jgi:hypothetical protein
MKLNAVAVGSDGESPVPVAHSTVGTAPIHIRREVRVRRPAPTRRGATGGEIGGTCGGGAVGHLDTSREVRHGALDVLLGSWIGRRARVHLRACLETALVLEHGALRDFPRAICAILHRARKHVVVPPVEEVAVQSVAGRVPVRENKPPAVVQLVEWVHTEPHFIEDGYDVDWMRRRALAGIDATWIRHMGLVIRRVEVHTIPAAREEHLCSETIWAARVCESWCLRLSRAVEVDAKLILFSYQLRCWCPKKEEADQDQDIACASSLPV